MLKKLTKENKGFTIIEVLIVLAIAGLILLIVFIAVPALQRNSRNTQRRNDVASVLGAVSEYSNNRNGTLPGSVAFNGKAVVFDAFAASQMDVPMGFYDGSVSGATATRNAGTAAVNNGTNINSIVLVVNSTCSGANAAPGASRSVAVLFSVEGNGGSPIRQCQAS